MTSTLNSKTFFKSFKEALIAYSFDFGGIIAGLLVASQLNVFQLYPWAIAVYPAILSARGMISGLFSGRLGTALHVGTIYPRLFGNTKTFYVLFRAIVVLTLETSVAMSLVSVLFGNLFWGITFLDFFDILIVVVSTMTLGLMLSLFTIAVSFVTFKRGLDPDVIEYPIMSTVADIFITASYVLTLNMYSLFNYAALFVGIIQVILALYILAKDIREKEFVKTIKESFFTLIFVAFIVNITGTVLRSISLEGCEEIYTVYPALIDMVGDVGSVVGSTATTKLALGLLKPSFSSMRNHAMHILSAWAASIIMFIFFSVTTLALGGKLYAFLGFTTLLLITNAFAVSVIILVSYAVSILTFQRGLDPDNFVIPIESSLADSITTIALLMALFLVRAI
ncbi:MAG: magnesium transporter [Candidatus Bathyarchaeota archaeon]|nr:magnesium transporter [Candidatus Bathyarchaeota archaeon]MDH5788442.1 magnesium transporter [Candidatus Bathyarchaeota archaeon]